MAVSSQAVPMAFGPGAEVLIEYEARAVAGKSATIDAMHASEVRGRGQ
jgi:hypothetical protein